MISARNKKRKNHKKTVKRKPEPTHENSENPPKSEISTTELETPSITNEKQEETKQQVIERFKKIREEITERNKPNGQLQPDNEPLPSVLTRKTGVKKAAKTDVGGD